MTVVETINQKVFQLPANAQKEVLELVEEVEKRYQLNRVRDTNGGGGKHVLDLLSEIQIDGPPDLAENHHKYAWGSVEE